MKIKRHAIIREIIESTAIETQEELAAALRARHIDVTQATVSRDIKTLRLVKVPAADGRYLYAFPEEKGARFSKERMARLFCDSVISLDYSENIIVVKTLPGAANAIASILDHTPWQEIVGTVAGDDSILVVVKPREAAPEVVRRMEKFFAQ